MYSVLWHNEKAKHTEGSETGYKIRMNDIINLKQMGIVVARDGEW